MEHTSPSYRYTYVVVVDTYQTPESTFFGAFVPDFPGCTAMGKSLEAVLQEIQRGLRKVLLHHLQQGIYIPQPSTVEKLTSEYLLAGEELVSSRGMIVLIEVLFDMLVSSERVAVAA